MRAKFSLEKSIILFKCPLKFEHKITEANDQCNNQYSITKEKALKKTKFMGWHGPARWQEPRGPNRVAGAHMRTGSLDLGAVQSFFSPELSSTEGQGHKPVRQGASRPPRRREF